MTSARIFFNNNEVFIILLAVILLALCGCCIKEYEHITSDIYVITYNNVFLYVANKLQ